MFAIQLVKEVDTRVDRFVTELVAVQPADENGAGSAIALGADHFGADQSQFVAKKIRQPGEGGLASDLVALAIHVHQQVIAHALHRLKILGFGKGERRLPNLFPILAWYIRSRRGSSALNRSSFLD